MEKVFWEEMLVETLTTMNKLCGLASLNNTIPELRRGFNEVHDRVQDLRNRACGGHLWPSKYNRIYRGVDEVFDGLYRDGHIEKSHHTHEARMKIMKMIEEELSK